MSDSVIERIRKIAIFSDFADDGERLGRIASKLKTRRYAAGSAIISEGDEGDTLFVLNGGNVRILRNTLSGESFALVNLSADDNVYFGEIALIDNDRRSATVTALTDCETLTLSRRDFLDLCEEDAVIGYRLTFQLALKMGSALRKSNRDMITMYQALLDEIS